MKYKERFVLTLLEAAATAFMAFRWDTNQAMRSMEGYGVLVFMVFRPGNFQMASLRTHVTILLKAAGSF